MDDKIISLLNSPDIKNFNLGWEFFNNLASNNLKESVSELCVYFKKPIEKIYLYNIINIRYLSSRNIDISFKKMPTLIYMLRHLEFISIVRTNLIQIPDLSNFSKLNSITFVGNRIDKIPDDLHRIPDDLHRIRDLRRLSFTNDLYECVPDVFFNSENFQKLEFLDLYDTKIQNYPKKVGNLIHQSNGHYY